MLMYMKAKINEWKFSRYTISPLVQGFNIDYCFIQIIIMGLSVTVIIVILFVQAKPTNLKHLYKWFQR